MSQDMKQLHANVAGIPTVIAAQVANLLAPVHAEVTEQRVRVLRQDECTAGLENKAIALEVAVSDLNSRPTAQPPGITCGVCSPGAPSNPWGNSPNVAPGIPGQAGASGLNDPMSILRVVISGNSSCHCMRVE